MSDQITKNCHYISRFLTRPWETEDGQRHLHYFDFDTLTFERRSSRSLFAEDQINSPAVEIWLRDTVETPLAQVRERLSCGDPKALDDWRFFRAAALMLWLQGVRSKSVVDEEVRRDLSGLAVLPEPELDVIVGLIGRDYDLRLVFTISEGRQFSPLSVPSSGIFPFTLRDTGCLSNYSIALGLPLGPRCALIATPVEEQGKLDFSLLQGSLSRLSVGTNLSRRVVIYPAVVASILQNQLREDLLEVRRRNDLLISSVQSVRDLVAEMFGKIGIRPAIDRTGRLPPRQA